MEEDKFKNSMTLKQLGDSGVYEGFGNVEGLKIPVAFYKKNDGPGRFAGKLFFTVYNPAKKEETARVVTLFDDNQKPDRFNGQIKAFWVNAYLYADSGTLKIHFNEKENKDGSN